MTVFFIDFRGSENEKPIVFGPILPMKKGWQINLAIAGAGLAILLAFHLSDRSQYLDWIGRNSILGGSRGCRPTRLSRKATSFAAFDGLTGLPQAEGPDGGQTATLHLQFGVPR
jgi:hypothetical protein